MHQNIQMSKIVAANHAFPLAYTGTVIPAAKLFLHAYGGNIIGQEQLNRLTISMLCVAT